jgi:hypothetical protein
MSGLAIAGAVWAGTAAAQTFSDPFAPAAGSVAQNADDAAKAAPADDKKPAPKPKRASARKGGESTITVVIYNKRTVGLVELTAAIAGTSDAKKIAGPLAINRKTVAHLKRDKSCLFDLKGSYADGADLDMANVELCKDKVINLTDE